MRKENDQNNVQKQNAKNQSNRQIYYQPPQPQDQGQSAFSETYYNQYSQPNSYQYPCQGPYQEPYVYDPAAELAATKQKLKALLTKYFVIAGAIFAGLFIISWIDLGAGTLMGQMSDSGYPIPVTILMFAVAGLFYSSGFVCAKEASQWIKQRMPEFLLLLTIPLWLILWGIKMFVCMIASQYLFPIHIIKWTIEIVQLKKEVKSLNQ